MSTIFIAVVNDTEIEVAKRTGKGQSRGVDIQWLSPLTSLLPDDQEVIPIDNTAQGVFNMSDLRMLKNSN